MCNKTRNQIWLWFEIKFEDKNCQKVYRLENEINYVKK